MAKSTKTGDPESSNFNASDDITLKALEQKLYLLPNSDISGFPFKQRSENELTSDLYQFVDWFEDKCRRSLLKLDRQDADACFFLLLRLKKSVRIALGSIGKSLNSAEQTYICSECQQEIYIDPWSDVWDALTNHEHFEKIYYDIISGKKSLSNLNSSKKVTPVTYDPARHAEVIKVSPRKGIKKATCCITDLLLSFKEKKLANGSTSSSSSNVSGSINKLTQEVSNSQPSTSAQNSISEPESPKYEQMIDPVIAKSESSKQTNECNTEINENINQVNDEVATTSSQAKNGITETFASVNITKSPIKEEAKPINSFKFNFRVTYHETTMKILYPEHLMTAIRKVDAIKDFTVQKSGPCRAICLVCTCELKHPSPFNKVNKNIIIGHVSGQRHIRNSKSQEIISALRSYHEFFLQQELFYQSQAIYFVPKLKTKARCILCNATITYAHILEHMVNKGHIERIISLINQTLGNGPKCFARELFEIQAEVCGFSLPTNVENEEGTAEDKASGENSKQGDKKKKKQRNSASSSTSPTDSSSSDNQRKPRHNIVKAKTGVDDILPNRYKDHVEFIKPSGTKYICEMCGLCVGSTQQEIKAHIRTENHLKVTNVPIPSYSYYCEICNITFANEILWDKHFEHDVKRHLAMAESRKNNVTEYECTVCRWVIYGDEISLLRHAPRKELEPRLSEPVKVLFANRQKIIETGTKLRDEANKVLDEQDPTFVCCKVLEKVLSDVYPLCKAYPFGSRISGFGNHDSDLDVFLDTGGMYTGERNQDSQSQIGFVTKSRSIFQKYKEEFGRIIAIPSARTPIVKLFHIRTDLECDISFRHGLSVENTKFLKYCIKVQPLLQMVVLLLKKWSAHCSFYEHITTYAFAMLAIFYMQVKGYLPSVAAIRILNPKPLLLIDGWEAFDDTLPIQAIASHLKPCDIDLVELMKGFFQFYSKFDFKKQVICPLLGNTIEKQLFTLDGSLLPPEMKTYVMKLHTEEEPEYFRSRSELCIQDPFDLTHNLTKACSEFVVNRLRKFCELTAAHLSSLK